MKKKLILTESQYNMILTESYYDSNKLYNKDYIVYMFRKSPRGLKQIVNNLDVIECVDDNGVPKECVRIPEVLFTYINGSY